VRADPVPLAWHATIEPRHAADPGLESIGPDEHTGRDELVARLEGLKPAPANEKSTRYRPEPDVDARVARSSEQGSREPVTTNAKCNSTVGRDARLYAAAERTETHPIKGLSVEFRGGNPELGERGDTARKHALSARLPLRPSRALENHHGAAGAREPDRNREAREAATRDRNVVHAEQRSKARSRSESRRGGPLRSER
jgi:hypothetical protein